jgi:hypothetical protein
VSDLQIGNRVRVKDGVDPRYSGKVGVVTEISSWAWPMPYLVQFDSGWRDTFDLEELELMVEEDANL